MRLDHVGAVGRIVTTRGGEAAHPIVELAGTVLLVHERVDAQVPSLLHGAVGVARPREIIRCVASRLEASSLQASWAALGSLRIHVWVLGAVARDLSGPSVRRCRGSHTREAGMSLTIKSGWSESWLSRIIQCNSSRLLLLIFNIYTALCVETKGLVRQRGELVKCLRCLGLLVPKVGGSFVSRRRYHTRVWHLLALKCVTQSESCLLVRLQRGLRSATIRHHETPFGLRLTEPTLVGASHHLQPIRCGGPFGVGAREIWVGCVSILRRVDIGRLVEGLAAGRRSSHLLGRGPLHEERSRGLGD